MWSPCLFSYLNDSLTVQRGNLFFFSPENIVSIIWVNICSKTHLDGTTQEQTITGICRQILVVMWCALGQWKGSRKMHWMQMNIWKIILFEVWRKIWRHDWSLRLYTTALYLYHGYPQFKIASFRSKPF